MTYGNTELLDPFAEGARGILRDLAWNSIAERFEEPFTTSGGDPIVMKRLQEALRYALKTGGQALLDEQQKVSELDLLAAFATIADLSANEYVAVALSTAGNDSALTSLFAAKGAADRVSIPANALKQVDIRINERRPFRVVYIHNHPQGILHEILGAAVLGPSARDRTHVTRAYNRWFGTGGIVRSEFYLVEGGKFRKFVLPSAQEAWAIALRLGIVTQPGDSNATVAHPIRQP